MPALEGGRVPTSLPRRHVPPPGRARGRRPSREAPPPGEPGLDGRVGSHVVAGVVCDVRVSVEGAVCDRVAAADQEGSLGEPPLEDLEGGPPRLEMPCERLRPLRLASGQPPEAGGADVRLEQVLLEEHPGVHTGALEAIGGKQRAALGKVEQDGAGFGDEVPLVGLEQRRATGGIAGQVSRRLALAAEDIDGDALVGKAELGEQHADLETVGRGGMLMESDHARKNALAGRTVR